MPEVVVYQQSYTASFFSDKEKYLDLTEEQYKLIKNHGNEVKFLELGGSLYNVSDIKSVVKVQPKSEDRFFRTTPENLINGANQ